MKRILFIVTIFGFLLLSNYEIGFSQMKLSLADDISFLDSTTLVYTNYNRNVIIKSLETFEDSIIEFENLRILNSLSLPDVNCLLLSTGDSSLYLIDYESKQILNTIKHGHELTLITASCDGKVIFTFSNNPNLELICYDNDFNEVWAIKNPHSKAKIVTINYGLTDMKYNNKKNILATCSSDEDIKLWNVAKGELIRTLIGHKKSINDMSFSPDGLYLASVGKDKTCKIWNIENGIAIHSFKSKNIITSVDFSPDGERVLFGTDDDYYEIWDVKKGLRIYKSEEIYDYKDMPLLEIRYSPDAKYIFARNGNFMRIWETVNYSKFND